MPLIDLHTHSTASDGSDSPSTLMDRAARAGLAAIALTDHDTVGGLAEARQAAGPLGVELVPGIEISTRLPGRSAELHVLGYFIDPDSDALRRMNELLLSVRAERNGKIISRLAEIGKPVQQEALESISDGVIGRPHFAQLMIRQGYVRTLNEAFTDYLGPGGQAYFDKARLSFAQAFETIHGAGGLAVMAHPVHLMLDSDMELEVLIGRLVDAGLDGIEAFHPDHSPRWARKVQLMAKRFGLCVTGGSDFHGLDRVARPLNCQRVDASFLDALKQRLADRRPSGEPAGPPAR